MKCRICGEKAIVKLKYANLPLCRKHFIEYFERRVFKTIIKYNMINENELIAVAVSGGKDSLALLYALNNLRDRLKFDIIAVHINLGIEKGNYSAISEKVSIENFKRVGVDYDIIKLSDYGFTIDDLVRNRLGGGRICSLCGAVKRYLLNKYARERGVDKIATGHNLDDFVSVILQGYVFGNIDGLSRYYVITPSMDGLVARIKPLIEISDKEARIYTIINNIKTVDENCPYARGATSLSLKKSMNLLESRHPGAKLSMMKTYIQSIFPLVREKYFKGDIVLKKCKICGEPTSSEAGLCLFCRIRRRLGILEG